MMAKHTKGGTWSGSTLPGAIKRLPSIAKGAPGKTGQSLSDGGWKSGGDKPCGKEGGQQA